MLELPHGAPFNVCEVGVMAGHSALLWLSASERVRYFGFDLGPPSNPYLALARESLEGWGFGNRTLVMLGDAMESAPMFADLAAPSFRCHALSVDFGHNPAHHQRILARLMPLAAEGWLIQYHTAGGHLEEWRALLSAARGELLRDAHVVAHGVGIGRVRDVPGDYGEQVAWYERAFSAS